MKYIVNNCPNMTIVRGQDLMCFDIEKMHGVPCQNRTDCVIKQITELCNDVLEQETDLLNSLEMSFARKILDLLGIEEVDEE